MDWADNSTELIFEHLNRRQNENRYVIADARSGRVRPVITDTDAAWVDILDTGSGGVRWVNAGRAFLFLSERDGWRHLYAESRDGGAPSLLTPGAFDVDEIKGYDASRGVIYFTASPGNATQRYLYLADEHAATAPRRVTPAADIGTNEYNVSPNGALAIHSVSRLDTPPRHEVVSLPDHAVARLLSDNHELKARLNAGLRGGSKFTQVTAADGETMDASLILPPGFNPARRYPVLFFVYGEPAATVVNDQWDGWNGIFDLIVAERGYIVARVDNRGTPALKGRAWRKSVFHKIGVIASQDQAAAARQLGTLPYVEGNRIAIWGWSGGGSMTLNMMFRYPEIYRVGMSVAPVPDMRLYDTIYQERYMGLPKENEAAYAEGSPITYANRLKGDLLVLHGSGDDNVHYAGTERLVNALVANGKPFQLMVYPNRTHSLDEGAGTSRHVYELLLRFLTTHMPAH
jgi:dipeptidyl-peptidase-4